MSHDQRFRDNYHLRQREAVHTIATHSAYQRRPVSVVPRMADYEGDASLCLTSVAFPEAAFAERIQAELIKPLRTLEPAHYYYPPTSLHVTVKNVRRISNPASFSKEQVTAAHATIGRVVPQFAPFQLFFDEAAPFQNSVSAIGYSEEIFGELVIALDGALRSVGLPDDKAYVSDTVFFGNMTICRFRDSPSKRFLRRLRDLSSELEAAIFVDVVSLIICNAVCHPASRRIVGTYRLKENANR